MRINTNMNAMTALNQSTKNTALAGNSMSKLSSGLRIDKAGDDAAGLAISEKMRAQIRGMEQASRNTQDGVSLVQTAEGAMEEIGNITQRMRELAVQASNDTNQASDRTKIQEEIKQLTDQIDNIAGSTKFNGESLLNGGGSTATIEGSKGIDSIRFSKDYTSGATISTSGSSSTSLTVSITDGDNTYEQTVNIKANQKGTVKLDSLGIEIELNGTTALDSAAIDTTIKSGGPDKNISIQTGSNTDSADIIGIRIAKADTQSLGIKSLDVSSQAAAQTSIDSLDKALEKINTSRASLGAMQNRLEYTDSNLTASTENLTAAESRIRDVDVAKEMMNLSKLNLLNQASQAMMSQAKSQPEGVMQLLR